MSTNDFCISNCEESELRRLLFESSTYTGRSAATLLVVKDTGRVNIEDVERVLALLGPKTLHQKVASASDLSESHLQELLLKAISTEQALLLELSVNPTPVLIETLRRASRDGVCSLRSSRSGATMDLELPEQCVLVVLIDQASIDSNISYERFYQLFEVIERI